MNLASLPRTAVAVAVCAVLLAGCGGPSDPVAAGAHVPASAVVPASGVFDASRVHSIAVTVDPSDYAAMVAAYERSQDKDWVHASVTIDGRTFSDVGLRLKGNLTLRTVDLDADPSAVPFLIRLDKFVDGQEIDGYREFAVRYSTGSGLNEAVALDLLRAAGLASERAVASRFSVNGSAETLRLVVQNPDDTWDAENFDSDGILYKAEARGDYSYRGTDPAAYEGVFDQEAGGSGGGTDNLDPLIGFLDFVNNSSDADFAAKLAERLDVDAFARYLALEALIANGDDISGGGNNSYLRYDSASTKFTVVAWDHNSAFGGGIGPGGAVGGGMGGGRGPGGDRNGLGPGGIGGPGGMGGRGGPGNRSNILERRFRAVPAFAALVTAASAELRASLYAGGAAQAALEEWVDVLTEHAYDLVAAADLTAEAARVSGYFGGAGTG